jgi:hypothetical protein
MFTDDVEQVGEVCRRVVERLASLAGTATRKP